MMYERGVLMRSMHMFGWILVPILGIMWWQGQQQQSASQPAPSQAIPPARIAVIDSTVFSSEQGIQQLQQQMRLLDEKYKPQFDELKRYQQEVAALEREINTKAANWTIEVRQQKQEELQDKQIKMKRLREDLERRYKRDLQRVTQPISERVRTYLQQYAKRRGITLILDVAPLNQAGAVPYLDKAIDVTEDFISEYNQKYPAIQPAKSSSP
ncbi:MAG: OmpH family outer membrane protein [Acidobacteria bacterium]|nr:MAG: OmpH family outer membrane protein [Acidobacteriota bacterium]